MLVFIHFLVGYLRYFRSCVFPIVNNAIMTILVHTYWRTHVRMVQIDTLKKMARLWELPNVQPFKIGPNCFQCACINL